MKLQWQRAGNLQVFRSPSTLDSNGKCLSSLRQRDSTPAIIPREKKWKRGESVLEMQHILSLVCQNITSLVIPYTADNLTATGESFGCPSAAREVWVFGTHHVKKPCWSGTYQGQLGRNSQSQEPLSAGLLTLQWQFPTWNQKQGKMREKFHPKVRWDCYPPPSRSHFFPIRAVKAV